MENFKQIFGLEKIEIHNVTKLIKNSSTEYHCDTHNASYPSLKSFMADHPDFVESEFVVVDKTHEALQKKLEQAWENDTTHTKIFSENDN